MIALLMDYYTTQGISVMNPKPIQDRTKHRALGSPMIEYLPIFIVQTITPIIKTTINGIGINL